MPPVSKVSQVSVLRVHHSTEDFRLKRNFSLLNKQFDLLVCGGGIYGAWTAYDAALRGLNVAIVEQHDWASTTSSASSKLIHGGLRYLQSYDFKLVKKSLNERQMLLKAAPHRVWPLHFGIPLTTHNPINWLRYKLGLMLYDWFASNANPTMQHRHLNQASFAKHFPALDPSTLKGGFSYADAQTDDARLVLELISGAMNAGAVAVNFSKMTRVIEKNGLAVGAMIEDQLTGNELEIHAKQIVNATGQWIANTEQGHDWCRMTKGAHLIMPAVLKDEALLLNAKSDERVFFMIPWYGCTLLGTTDTDYTDSSTRASVDSSDINYLLAAANDYLKTSWTESDIIGRFAGVRVLKQSKASEPSAISRDWELKTADNGAHYSIGGKITSARQDAAQIVDAVCSKLGVKAPCTTQDRPFPWAPQEDFAGWFSSMLQKSIQLGVDAKSATWLIRRHGIRAVEILQHIEKNPKLNRRIIPSIPFIFADLEFCARTEMVVHLDDLLRRRMPLLILTQLTTHELQQITAHIADAMQWDNAIINAEIERCRQQWMLH